MKKYIAIILITLALMAGVFIWMKMQDRSARMVADHYPYIPQRTAAVVATDMKALKDMFTRQAISDPVGMLAMKDSIQDRFPVEQELFKMLGSSGLNTSNQIIAYISSDNIPSAGVLLGIEDAEKFSAFQNEIRKKYTFRKTSGEDVSEYYSDSLKLFIAWDQHWCYLSFAREISSQQNIWMDIKERKNIQPADSLLIEKILNIPTPFKACLKSEWLEQKLPFFRHIPDLMIALDYDQETARATIYPAVKDPLYQSWWSASHAVRKQHDSSALQVRINTTISDTILKAVLKQETFGQADSLFHIVNLSFTNLMKHWNGYADLTITGRGQISEAYVTYSYDDDFNKIEKKNIVTRDIINFDALFGSEKNTLYQYLTRQGVVRKKGGVPVLVELPFQEIYTRTLPGGVNFSSGKEPGEISVMTNDTCAFFLMMDVKRTGDLWKGKTSWLKNFPIRKVEVRVAIESRP